MQMPLSFRQNYQCCPVATETVLSDLLNLLRYRMAGITESAMVAYTHKYAEV